MGTITLYGYHGTTNYYAANIIKENRFRLSIKENEWLGKGIYFWTTEENGIWWAKLQLEKHNPDATLHTKPYVLKCRLRCLSEEYINLSTDMYRLTDFVSQYETELRKNGQHKPSFKNQEERKNYYCTLFKNRYKIKIIEYPFKYTRPNIAGFVEYFERTQICVSDNSHITILHNEE